MLPAGSGEVQAKDQAWTDRPWQVKPGIIVIDWVAVACFLQIFVAAERVAPLSPFQVLTGGLDDGDKLVKVLSR